MFPNLARELVPDGRKVIWNVALVLDAWSRRVVGYAIGRSIVTRTAAAALQIAIPSRPASGQLPLPSLVLLLLIRPCTKSLCPIPSLVICVRVH